MFRFSCSLQWIYCNQGFTLLFFSFSHEKNINNKKIIKAPNYSLIYRYLLKKNFVTLYLRPLVQVEKSRRRYNMNRHLFWNHKPKRRSPVQGTSSASQASSLHHLITENRDAYTPCLRSTEAMGCIYMSRVFEKVWSWREIS